MLLSDGIAYRDEVTVEVDAVCLQVVISVHVGVWCAYPLCVEQEGIQLAGVGVARSVGELDEGLAITYLRADGSPDGLPQANAPRPFPEFTLVLVALIAESVYLETGASPHDAFGMADYHSGQPGVIVALVA